MRAVEHPPEVSVPEASQHGGVGIARLVGEAMMAAMSARPPERPVLHRAAAEPGQDELEEAARLEGAMREVSVIPRGDAEHLEQIAAKGDRGDPPGERHEGREDAETLHAEDDARRAQVDQLRTQPRSRQGRDRALAGDRSHSCCCVAASVIALPDYGRLGDDAPPALSKTRSNGNQAGF
jgi:hypothetical protein